MKKHGLIMVNGKARYNCYSDWGKSAFVADNFKQIDSKFIKDGYNVTFYFDCTSKRQYFDDFESAEKAMFNFVKYSKGV